MSYLQRMKSIFSGLFLLLIALLLLLLPKEGFSLIVAFLSASVFLYCIRLFLYYLTLARHMVGGKSILCRAILLLDLALFMTTLTSMSTFIIMFYLLGIYAFTGAIDILRALEARRLGASSWRTKLLTGIIIVVLSIVLFLVSVITKSTDFLVYGYCLLLVYSAIMKIVTAFRKTAVVYIQ